MLSETATSLTTTREITAAERAFIERMPKAELHVHLEGSVYPETLLKLAAKNGRELPFASVEGARDWFQFRNFPHFIEIYVEVCTNLVDVEDYELITVEQARRAAAENIRYQEVIFATMTLDNPRTPAVPDVVIAGLRAGARRARAEYGVEMQFILDPVRGRTEEEVMALARWWTANAGEGLIGFGLGGYEFGNPASRYADAFRLVRDAGARLSLHAGETDGPASIRDALLNGSERIGHGVRSIEDPDLVAELAERQIVLEVSPTSNVRLGVFPDYAAHPMRVLHDAGVPVTVNSDDPPMFDTTLTNEYLILAERFGYSTDDLVTLSLRAVDAAFMPDGERERLRVSYQQELDALRAELFSDTA